MKKSVNMIINDICNIGGRVYDLYGVNCRPYGSRYINMVMDMAKEINMAFNIKDLTPEVINGLTENNAHMETHAIDIIKSLEKYALFEYESLNK